MKFLPMLHRRPNGIHRDPFIFCLTALEQGFRRNFPFGNLTQKIRFTDWPNPAILAYPAARHVVPSDSHRIVPPYEMIDLK